MLLKIKLCFLGALISYLGIAGLKEIYALELVQVFQNVRLSRPIFLTSAGDQSNRIFIVEQEGVIKVVSQKTKRAQVFLDITDRVRNIGNEEGLLSIAFHPKFHDTGFLYVNYSASFPRRTIISRFRISNDPNKVLSKSENRILEIKQPYGNHNGGQIEFGKDGYLYIGMGDGGSAGDPQEHGQNLKTLLGALLRIDVDHKGLKKGYSIPSDNPFRNVRGAKQEIWAYGLRNPWRFSFDRQTGELYAGDVGQDEYEEIDLIEKGKNYGWNIMEGKHCYSSGWLSALRNCNQEGKVLPLVEYNHSQGISVTGGYVYRGQKIKYLQGTYIYADFGSGKIWGLTRRNNRVVSNQLLVDTNLLISSFGEDEEGEIYVVDLGGTIHLLKP